MGTISDADVTLSMDGGPRDGDGQVAVGRVLAGRYELRELLGRGAQGEVYRAHDRVAGTDVAIKSLGALRRSRITPERLRRELRAAWTVTHPNVVRIHDVIVDGDQVALSMQLVAGETLRDRLDRGGRLAVAELLRLGGELAGALAAAHAAGVVHRDLKPSNILIADDGRALVSDFGLSRLGIGADTPAGAPVDPTVFADLTATGDLLGTPAYMAPEQLHRAGDVGPAADIYAFGLVMFEAATGARAHLGATLPELVHERLERPAPSAGARRRDLPPRFARTIDACLATDPARRIRDGGALAARLAARSRRAWWAIAALAVVAAATASAWAARRTPRRAGAPAISIERPETGLLQLAVVVPNAIVQRVWRGANGDVFAIGHATGPFAVGDDALELPAGIHSGFVLALAPDGGVRWHRELTGGRHVQLVDAADADGLVVGVGASAGAVPLGDGIALPKPRINEIPDCYVVALDERDGGTRWAVPCGATHSGQGRAVVADGRGTVYVAGEFIGDASFGGSATVHTSPSQRGVFVASYRTSDGALRWVTTSGEVGGITRAFALAVHGDELVLGGMIAGHSTLGGAAIEADRDGDGLVATLDLATGAVRRIRLLRATGDATVSGVAVTGDGQIAIGGTFAGAVEVMPGRTLRSRDGHDAFVALLDPDMTPRWAIAGAGTMYEAVRDVAVTPTGIVAVGRFDVDLAFGDRSLASTTAGEGFVVELARDDGAVRSLVGLGGDGPVRARSVTVGRDGAVAIAGRCMSRFAIGETMVTGAGSTNGFAIELRPRR